MCALHEGSPEVQPVPEPLPVRATRRATYRIARVRVPLTLTVRPWATMYLLPDGRRIWCLRLRECGEVRRRCVPTDRLRRYARESGLDELESAIEEAESIARRRGSDARGG